MIIGYIAAFISFIGIILNAKRKLLCWPIWIISNIFWIYYSISKNDTPSIILWSMFIGANVWGWYSWIKDKKSPKKDENISDDLETT